MSSDQSQLDASVRFVRFLLVGAACAVLALSLRALFYLVLNYEVSVALSQFLAMLVGFFLNLTFVFGGFSGRLMPAFARFAMVNMASLVIAVLVSSVTFRLVFPAIGGVPMPELLAHAIGAASAAIPSFLGHSFFSFRRAAQAR